MAQLVIQPINYNGHRLYEIGEQVVKQFYPLIHDFDIRRGLDIKDMDGFAPRLEPKGSGSTIIYPDGSTPATSLFILFLYGINGQMNGPTLGVTSLKALDSKGKYLYGEGLSKWMSGFVTDYRPEGSAFKDFPQLSVHEVGHMYGLKHHFPDKNQKNGKNCAMYINDDGNGKKMFQGNEARDFFASIDGSLCTLCDDILAEIDL